MMNTRKTQAQDKEDMLLDLYKIHAYNPNDAIGNPLTPFGNFCAGYEACQTLNYKRIAELEEKLKVAREANTALVNFARDIIFPSNGAYLFSDVDGFDIEELALKHGLVKETTMTEPCGENCACAEYAYSFPTQCNRATELIALKTIEG